MGHCCPLLSIVSGQARFRANPLTTPADIPEPRIDPRIVVTEPSHIAATNLISAPSVAYRFTITKREASMVRRD
jgi:hypothetical protein